MIKWNDVLDGTPPAKDEEFSILVLCWICPGHIVSGYYDSNDEDWYDQDGELIHDVGYWADHPEDPV